MRASVEQIARVCHEANRAWCEANGDLSQVHWDIAEQWQRDSAMEGVTQALNGATPEQLHEAWCLNKLADGWLYGKRKEPAAKLHPCLVPYDELPVEQRAKDHLCFAIVQALST